MFDERKSYGKNKRQLDKTKKEREKNVKAGLQIKMAFDIQILSCLLSL